MSEFQFITSNQELEEVENPYIEFLSINEALTKGILSPDMLTEMEGIDRDEKVLMNVESEEHLEEIEIKRELYYAEENVAAYSKKPYVVELRWRYTEDRARQLIDYITNHLQSVDEVEIWKVWVDEQTEPDVRSVSLHDVTIEDLCFLGNVGFERPECLIIKK